MADFTADVQVRLYRAGLYDAANAIDVAFSQGAVAIAAAFNRGRRLLEQSRASIDMTI